MILCDGHGVSIDYPKIECVPYLKHNIINKVVKLEFQLGFYHFSFCKPLSTFKRALFYYMLCISSMHALLLKENRICALNLLNFITTVSLLRKPSPIFGLCREN